MKKVSKVNQVKEMLANDPALKVEKVMETMGVKKAYAYTLISEAKKAKPKAKRKYTRTAPLKRDNMVVLGKEILKGRQAIDNLISENNRLRNVLQEQGNTITALKIDMLDQQAIINYLEKKLYK
jgi:hypothetical protein